jgi:hypothetical protein
MILLIERLGLLTRLFKVRIHLKLRSSPSRDILNAKCESTIIFCHSKRRKKAPLPGTDFSDRWLTIKLTVANQAPEKAISFLNFLQKNYSIYFLRLFPSTVIALLLSAILVHEVSRCVSCPRKNLVRNNDFPRSKSNPKSFHELKADIAPIGLISDSAMPKLDPELPAAY